ncbi:DUF3152 domain-containing protein [Actinoplanes sp. NPDC051859]|uniref:DUF3152 domain-containing protein n=1 Tax=Actinoplanes sp. NPDC051859 TaxID=3363909 RepID=UPI0037AF5F08
MNRSRWVLAALLLLILPGLVLIGVAVYRPQTSAAQRAIAEPTAAAPARPATQPDRSTRVEKITYPARGSADWNIAPGATQTAGRSGDLLRYRVLVERDIGGVSPAAFAKEASAALDDPRGWTADGSLRLRRVGPGQSYDFTIYLATPRTRDALCKYGADSYTSCRLEDDVVINVARWAKGVPDYGAALPAYRQYVINHEVGHRLGYNHEKCPGKGEPAPVMQQQTLGLHGCEANSWPYRDGKRYSGEPGQYDDPVPEPEGAR